jgi:hypothetical protein
MKNLTQGTSASSRSADAAINPVQWYGLLLPKTCVKLAIYQATSGAHTMRNTTTISIDLAKNVFQVAVFNKHGNLKSTRR